MQRTLERSGIVNKLRALGAKEGITVRIREIEFNFVDEDAVDAPEDGDDEEDEP